MTQKLLVVLFTVLSAALFFNSCNTSKSYSKKGVRLKEAGLSEEAAEYFLVALQKNANNIDARILLKKEGQKLLDEKLEKFYKLYTAEDFIGATLKYIDAQEYMKLVDPYVKLEMAPYYADYFVESKKVYLEDRYQKASKLINENKFDAANVFLIQILEVDPTYKDVTSLKNYSDVEPLYLAAVTDFEAKRYRKAYNLFSRVIQMSGDYKQASYYKEESLKMGRLTIAVLNIESEKDQISMALSLNRLILQMGSSKPNAFLVYLDRESTQAVISEQKLGLTGLLDDKTVAETGKLLGAKLLVRGKILDYKHTSSALINKSEKGYYESVVRKYNKTKGYYYNEKTYSKTSYNVYSMERVVECRIQLTLISAETGEVVLSQTYPAKETHKLEYAIYSKDAKNLYPGYYKSTRYSSPEDKVNTNIVAKQKLDRMISEKDRELKSEKEIKAELVKIVAQDWAQKIRKYEKGLE